ncbi:MAG: hypothetical protein A2268_09765 [Candidatus Raymondbacteria bacterium RifOxyA12_full_50_37]|uniref:Uncharacterized protein n=1 Tax=Candidatus Raymondbacteria bacterium RIFOXYD12_FULL_49_13 TaxID=1817890 RepID=A0A1F7F1F3_UNCRA|nr:MAG: hypothetical protein A2268_09765 [Candidatus Raymondbacteria bacterium RifOxyA12_full_50_37]OGJ93875.1 MAG: hypothetical protein A2248_06530 [Candidatus Raymondbacteria bacterium RIFOXYA2_FULL_49_16]OGJ98256.1 MAG: hypothetical protein A2453_00635 [Candidatus Raymondbacteria bacterium RIFOXYC2_FULL_50_21]OGJ98420.1 MAG: hypothetical protein A2350_14265 [Candidatus Raymondbacteria bacterium RifOxyB12_full_50_8]OGK00489.1 MAG: hypothetical protein A2519_10810 [Candidatus Raymondbacteria b
MTKVKIGLVGSGHFGRYHIQNLLALHDYCDIIGINDIDVQQGQSVAGKYGLTFYDDCHRLFHAVDAVIVAVNAASHAGVAEKVIDAGKHLFIEKPMTANAAEARHLLQRAEAGSVKIQVGHIERYNSVLYNFFNEPLRDAIVIITRISPFSPRGTDVSVVHDLMIHDLDILNSVLNESPCAITASGVREKSLFLDSCIAHLTYSAGLTVTIEASRISDSRIRKYCGIFQGKHKEVDLDSQSGLENPLRNELQSFLETISNKAPITVDGSNGLRAVELADAIVRASSH